MEKYAIKGMSCAACAARVERAVSALPGVESCSVNLLTNSMRLVGDVPPAAVERAVADAGYSASLMGDAGRAAAGSPRPQAGRPGEGNATHGSGFSPLFGRLAASALLLLALMYISMGHVMWGWPLPPSLAADPMAIGLSQLLLTAAVLVVNQHYFISGVRGALHRAPNMDTLVALGAGAAFLYSTLLLYRVSAAQLAGDPAAAMHAVHGLYFESAAMIVTLITVGKLLEARAKGKTTDALRGLAALTPGTATLLRDGAEVTVPVGEVRPGDIFLVYPGESVPVDGVVEEGEGAIDESALTGESLPVDKRPGDTVSAATLNRSGFLRCRATRVGEDTTLSQIIRLVEDTAAQKAPIAKVADRVSAVFVPAVLAIALVTAAVWLLLGAGVGVALSRGISVLVISCPCALGLATPVAIMVGSGVGARQGILFKTAAALEGLGRVRTVVLDKTGTVTCGTPHLTDTVPAPGVSGEELLSLALALEAKSEHPLADAVTEAGRAAGLRVREVRDFAVHPGRGLSARLDGQTVIGGNRAYLDAEGLTLPPALLARAEQLAGEGKTPLWFAADGRVMGILAVADVLKEDSPAAIDEMRRMGLRVIMLTGDHERTARAVAAQAGIGDVIAGVLPDEKAAAVMALRREGRVLMVGDGINDAPALTAADIGIAIGTGTDIARDAADVVLVNSRLSDLPTALRLSRATLRNIYGNLFWAFFYNLLGIPLAAGVFVSLLGWEISPMLAAAAMSLSSFSVVTNALRLNLFRPKQHQKSIQAQKETEHMEKTMRIEGMMCPHCEARVKQLLEAIAGVEEAEVSHKDGTAVLRLSLPVDDGLLRTTVEQAGYRVL